jgi:hypothetical protein
MMLFVQWNSSVDFNDARLAATEAPEIFASGGGLVFTSGFCPPFIDQSALIVTWAPIPHTLARSASWRGGESNGRSEEEKVGRVGWGCA